MQNMYHPKSQFRKIELHQDHNSHWRWRISRNNRIIAAAEEGFEDKADCLRNLKTYALEILSWVEAGNVS
ncbi:DUF1508 domain-containing protein [Foetidibacter luteolus]|uniref:DUF1508 domain-containing protein n=1 Tax=Foetidibacter luteolus TaxID=2608880 RepID=UPI00129BDD69|nr:DUF1508 domain-containing protein [Foetidibacter luteolus]